MHDVDHMLNGSHSRHLHQQMVKEAEQRRIAEQVYREKKGNKRSLRNILFNLSNMLLVK
mgnify:CR=1 FL=1